MSKNISVLFNSFVKDIIEVFPEYEKRLFKYYETILEIKEKVEEKKGEEQKQEQEQEQEQGQESEKETSSDESSDEDSQESEDEEEKVEDSEEEKVEDSEDIYKDMDEKLKEFLDNVNEISDKVAEKDITLFNDDPIILQNVSFKTIWNSDISTKTKNSIWKYLQSFCIIKINIESGEKISNVLKSIKSKEKVRDRKTLKKIKKLKKLNEKINIDEINKIINDNPESINSGLEEMEGLFKNTSIGKIAQEISEDLDLENMMSDEGGGIENLLNGDNMMNILSKITGRLGEGGGVGEDTLMDEASQICSSMQSNPIFSSLMGMQGDLFSNIGAKNPTQTNTMNNSKQEKNVKNIQLGNDSNHNPNATRQRLQKKLEEKNKLNIEKKE